jgi:type IV secretion system protein VirB5
VAAAVLEFLRDRLKNFGDRPRKEPIMIIRQIRTLAALVALYGLMPTAHAQFAVIDVASLTQLISEVQTLEQQLSTARNQLTQAQAEYQSITGSRGMQQLLAGTTRNYLPADWTGLLAVLRGGAGYPTLASAMQGGMRSSTALSANQLSMLAPAAATQLQAQRSTAALLAGVSQDALANTSSRFAAVQQLIDAIGRADDQKSILELQARIAAEQGMLLNEHTKLQVLSAGAQAQQWSDVQRAHELAVAGHGQFETRFQPHP